MLRDVVINLQSVHGYDTDNADIMEFTTDGLYTMDNGVGCITYEESELTGMEGTRTSVFIMPDKIVVDRDGSVTSRMIFKEGEKSSFLYNTPFGKTTLGIRTSTIKQQLDDHEANVEIDFVMDMNHMVASRNKVSIEVRNA